MTDLLELKKRKATVDIDGQKIDIVGLSLRQITDLIDRFEKLDGLANKSIMEVVKSAGADAAGAIIAAGVGKAADEKYQKFAANEIDFGPQVEIIDAILKLSVPKGDGPLATALSELIEMLLPMADIKAAIAAAASPSNSPLPPPALPASGPDPNKSGT